MERWEYMKLTLDWRESATWADALNAFGAEGWELAVGCVPQLPVPLMGVVSDVPPLVLLMKRRRGG